MDHKEEIGKAFKEKLDQLDASPDPAVWTAISEKLDKKDKERRILVIPLWWKLGGVAAIIALMFTLGSKYVGSSDGTVTNTNSEIVTNASDSLPENELLKLSENPTPISTTDNKEESSQSIPKYSNTPKNDRLDVANETSDDLNHSNRVATEDVSEIKEKEVNTELEQSNNFPTPKSQADQANKSISERIAFEKQQQKILGDSLFIEKTNGVVSPIASNEQINKEAIDNDSLVAIRTTPINKDILEEIQQIQNAKDSVIAADGNSRWTVSTYVAPVYYNSLTQGSSLDPSLESNGREGGVNISFGIRAQYGVSSKIAIRGGVNRTKLAYTTNDGLVVSAESNIFLSGVAIDNDELEIPISNDGSSSDFDLTQEITYVELPFELAYRVVDNRFGLTLIGGMSLFVLDSNDVFISNNESERMRFGSATNLNSVSYSSNFGLGFTYDLGSSFQFNLEPMLKIQWNTYTNDTSTFKPYVLGVYSGFSYQF